MNKHKLNLERAVFQHRIAAGNIVTRNAIDNLQRKWELLNPRTTGPSAQRVRDVRLHAGGSGNRFPLFR